MKKKRVTTTICLLFRPRRVCILVLFWLKFEYSFRISLAFLQKQTMPKKRASAGDKARWNRIVGTKETLEEE